jgi:hypothetical protein
MKYFLYFIKVEHLFFIEDRNHFSCKAITLLSWIRIFLTCDKFEADPQY